MAGEWVEVPTDVLKEARNRKGLSYEAAARQVPVASKTWERWEKRGRIPIFHVERVGRILDLEIERPAFDERITLPGGDDGSIDPDRLDRMEARVEEAISLLQEVRAAVLSQPATRPATRTGTSRVRRDN